MTLKELMKIAYVDELDITIIEGEETDHLTLTKHSCLMDDYEDSEVYRIDKFIENSQPSSLDGSVVATPRIRVFVRSNHH